MIIVFGILVTLLIDYSFYHAKKKRIAERYNNNDVMNSTDIIAALRSGTP